MRLRRPLPAVQGDTLHIVGVGDNRIGKNYTSFLISFGYHMELRQLRHLLAIAEHQNFHRAAQALNLTQPAISKSLRKLEEILGTALVERSKRGVTLTPLESVRRLYVGLQSFRSMSRMDASLMKASALRLRFSQSLASRRQRLSQAMVRSTTQRLGWTTKPFTRSDRLTISVSRSGRMPARAR